MTTFEQFEHTPAGASGVSRTLELGVERDPASGCRVHYLEVEDIESVIESDERQYIQGVIETWDQMLQDNSGWEAPQVDKDTGEFILKNDVSRWLYGPENPSLLEWAKSIKTAKALYPLQRPYSPRLPGETTPGGRLLNGAEIDDNSRLFLLHGLDAIGIRSRAVIMAELVGKYYNPDVSNNWVSLACGAAVPVLDALQEIGAGEEVHLDLIDWDSDALAFADQLAKEQGMVRGDHYSLRRDNLVRGLIASDRLVDELGEGSAQIVDMMGIFEYFDHQRAAQMLRNAYRLVDEGGVLIAANMLSSRPQLAFNQRGVGWPGIHPRSLEDIGAVVKDAGIPIDNVDIYIPSDGIYAVMELRK